MELFDPTSFEEFGQGQGQHLTLMGTVFQGSNPEDNDGDEDFNLDEEISNDNESGKKINHIFYAIHYIISFCSVSNKVTQHWFIHRFFFIFISKKK